MATLTELRAEVTAELAAALPGWPVHAYVPDKMRAPCVLLTEDDPFIEADSMGAWTVRFVARFVAEPTKTNEAMVQQLDGAMEAILNPDAVQAGKTFGSYESQVHASGQAYLTAPIIITTTLEV